MEKNITKQVSELENFVIDRWRKKYRFGEITLKIFEGEPQCIVKAVFNDRLEKNDKTNKN